MLPYLTTEDAASAVGHNLTFFESLWFDYLAQKSDIFLHCHTIFFAVVIYTVVPLPWVLIELVGPAKLEKYKIQPTVRLSFSDMLKCYKDDMKLYLVCNFPMVLMGSTSMKIIPYQIGIGPN